MFCNHAFKAVFRYYSAFLFFQCCLCVTSGICVIRFLEHLWLLRRTPTLSELCNPMSLLLHSFVWTSLSTRCATDDSDDHQSRKAFLSISSSACRGNCAPQLLPSLGSFSQSARLHKQYPSVCRLLQKANRERAGGAKHQDWRALGALVMPKERQANSSAAFPSFQAAVGVPKACPVSF